MGSIEQEDYGIIRFTVPDTSVSPSERALYTLPGNKSIHDTRVKLHDFSCQYTRSANDVVYGPTGLDRQGFAFVKHEPSLQYNDWCSGSNIEDFYLPEVEDLVKAVTGCKKVVVYCVAFRRRIAKEQGVEKVERRRGETDQFVGCLPRDRCLITGRDAWSTEPSRQVHTDITPKGLFETLRSCRRDIYEAAKPVLEATEKGTEVPRYAAFGVWRPIKAVQRDPIVVCDSRTNDKNELAPVDFRALSEVTESHDYSMQASMGLPPKNPEKQKWYWIPDQRPDDVLFIKHSDSASGTVQEDGIVVAPGCLHTSAIVEGTEHMEARESVEARVYAFW